MNNKNSYHISGDLPFVASAILTGRVEIKKVTFHPQKTNVKEYHLSPKKEAESIYLEYVSDKLSLPPKRLSDKIHAIKYLPVEKEGGDWK